MKTARNSKKLLAKTLSKGLTKACVYARIYVLYIVTE